MKRALNRIIAFDIAFWKVIRYFSLPFIIFSISLVFSCGGGGGGGGSTGTGAGTAPKIPQAEILIGWWTEMPNSGAWPGYAENGCNFFNIGGANWFTAAEVRAQLDIVQSLGGKASIDMQRGSGFPELNLSDYTNFVNTVKTHPALWGYYIADEPDLCPERGLSVQECHDRLALDPGWYPITKAADPNHYSWLVCANAICPEFNDVADIVAIDSYPVYDDACEFCTNEIRRQPDIQQTGVDNAERLNKGPYIAMVQAFAAMRWSEPTLPEMKYQSFTALVQGARVILWWNDEWANDSIKNKVAQIQKMIRDVRTQLDSSIKNDPMVSVNQNLIAQDKLIFRYGIVGNAGALLAVNIANRGSSDGETLSAVQFTLPAGVRANQVEVIGEGRTLPVTNGVFTDNFDRFQVHLYRFSY